MRTLLAALLLAATQAKVIKPGQHYTLDPSRDSCTTIVVGRAATGDGGPLTSHTNDCNACDFRLSKVPAKKVDKDDERALYRYRAEYPRYVGTDKGATYTHVKDYYDWRHGKGDFKPMGSLPYETEHTYALIDGAYGMMNDQDLAIGESTCGARITALPVSEGGAALMDARELSWIALERCATARCAVELMGALAEKHGFYGADATAGEGGEALTLVDREEAWVFHVLADDSGSSAVWVARKVPPDSVAVVANQFVITTLPESEEGTEWLGSSNLQEVATRSGLWDGTGEFNFLQIYGLSMLHLSTYATRRKWRVFDAAAPSLNLPPDTDQWGSSYPFSVKVEGFLGAKEVMTLLRDHYEGTPYDLTQGLSSGPHGDPARWDMADTTNAGYASADTTSLVEATSGKFERAISIFRASYSFVSQSRGATSDLPSVLWVGQYAPHSTSYVPLYVASDALPEAFSTGSLHDVDHTSQYWASALVGNWAGRLYDISYPLVQRHIEDMAEEIHARRRKAESKALERPTERTQILSSLSNETSIYVREAWWALFWDLCSTVKDGQRLDDRHAEKLKPTKVFYSRKWLDAIGFFPNGGSLTEASVLSVDVLKYLLAFVLGAVGAAAFTRRAHAPVTTRPTDYGVVSAEMA
jgi:dipeptidase